LSLDVRDENFLGGGTELGLILTGGTRNRKFLVEHKSNRILDTYLTYKINSFYEIDDVFYYQNKIMDDRRRFSRVQAGEYRQIYYGASVSAGTQVERFGNLIFTGKYHVAEVKNLAGNEVNPFKDNIISLMISSTIDTQDKFPFPASGFYFSASYETAQKMFGGDVGFTNVNFSYWNHVTFSNRHTFTPRIEMGFGDKTLPLTYHYSLGGQNSFFGLNEDEFRGRQIFISSLEYRFKLPFKIFFDSFFKFRYDLGSAWEVQDQIRFNDLKHGVGTTLSFDTPVGPADFSAGRSFIFIKHTGDNYISWGDVKFYFSIGYQL
jgi:NTE family protein